MSTPELLTSEGTAWPSFALGTIPAGIGPHSNGMRMTPEEFDAICAFDDCYTYELIQGVLVVNPIPSPRETDPNEELGYVLRDYQKHHAQGKHLDKTLIEQYVYTPDGRRRADRLLWAGLGRTPNLRSDIPSIVVEFVSRAKRDRRRDYVDKRRVYLELGIKQYWVIDRFARTLTVFQSPAPEETIIKEFEVYTTALLPGLELRLEEILAVADDWPDDLTSPQDTSHD